jgi:hypothetical protein
VNPWWRWFESLNAKGAKGFGAGERIKVYPRFGRPEVDLPFPPGNINALLRLPFMWQPVCLRQIQPE